MTIFYCKLVCGLKADVSVTLLCKKYLKTGKTEFDISFIALDIQSIIAVFVDRISRNVIISLVNFA